MISGYDQDVDSSCEGTELPVSSYPQQMAQFLFGVYYIVCSAT